MERNAVVIRLDAKLEAVLKEQANRTGVDPEELALTVLRSGLQTTLQPRDDWERGLLEGARPWGVSLSDAALSSEGLYD